MSVISPEAYKDAFGRFQNADGMMSTNAARTFFFLLDFQKEKSITGNLIETGVYKGKSATILCSLAAPTEKIFLIDVGYQEHQQHLLEIHSNCVFIKDKSENINIDEAGKEFEEIRFFHADGSHRFSNVYADMSLADKILREDGVIALDDFWNVQFPQVQAGCYKYIFENPTRFSMFFTGENKAYLCRPSWHGKYFNACLEKFPEFMSSFNVGVRVAKTDKDVEYNTLSYIAKEGEVLESYYGENIYGGYYKKLQE